MMTIDTAKLKAAAQGALQPHERLSALPTNDIFDISLAEGTQLDADITAVNAFHDESTPAKILKLIAALEAADRRNAELNSTLERWATDRAQSASELEAAEKRNAELDERLIRYAGIATRRAEHVAELEKRVAELEARAVKLPKRSVGEVMRLSGFSREYAEGWCSGNDNARHEIQLAGINLETGGE
ncbi:ead/Ea22-like family protein [Cronobacter sakazakii]|uniref:ead/Ea22-like family protein n=1 Tax=Cronobacter sakazakii TaxID=28141 RepID=UPI000A10930E|nr:ead/Ea22-like family protein [Cronobacter sakazakii]KAB1479391.1 ead/Ea22-like family protein [Cronobacter sakazakii]